MAPDGQQVWKQPDKNVWQVAVVDTDGDGVPEIVHSNAGGFLTVRNGGGAIIRNARPENYFSHFSFMDGRILTVGKGHIFLLDFDGNSVKDFFAPEANPNGSVQGAVVRFRDGGPAHYAFAVSYKNWNRCGLYIFTDYGMLEYHEILGERCEAIAPSPGPGGSQTLLLGGNSKIWQYKKIR